MGKKKWKTLDEEDDMIECDNKDIVVPKIRGSNYIQIKFIDNNGKTIFSETFINRKISLVKREKFRNELMELLEKFSW